MFRKTLVVLGLAAAMPLVGSFGGVAHAQIDVSNSKVTCVTLLQTQIKISPAVVLGGTQPATLKLKGKLAGCTSDAGGFTIPDGKSTFKAALSLPNNDCTGLVTGAPATGGAR